MASGGEIGDRTVRRHPGTRKEGDGLGARWPLIFRARGNTWVQAECRHGGSSRLGHGRSRPRGPRRRASVGEPAGRRAVDVPAEDTAGGPARVADPPVNQGLSTALTRPECSRSVLACQIHRLRDGRSRRTRIRSNWLAPRRRETRMRDPAPPVASTCAQRMVEGAPVAQRAEDPLGRKARRAGRGAPLRLATERSAAWRLRGRVPQSERDATSGVAIRSVSRSACRAQAAPAANAARHRPATLGLHPSSSRRVASPHATTTPVDSMKTITSVVAEPAGAGLALRP